DLDLHDLVAAMTLLGRRRNALFAQTEFLSALGAGRDFEMRAAVDGRHFDLGAERGLHRGDRHRDIDVVAFPAKHRMLTDADDDVEVAMRTAARSCVALAGQTDALSVARARLDADFHGLAAVHHAFAVADRARHTLFARAAAIGTGRV